MLTNIKTVMMGVGPAVAVAAANSSSLSSIASLTCAPLAPFPQF